MIANNNVLMTRCLLAIVIACCVIPNSHLVVAKKEKYFERPGILPRDILKARGYLAEDFNLLSADGYRIRITRGRNPLINNGQGGLPGRVPILFIHGVLESANVFVVNSFNVRPSDFSQINIKGVPLEELNFKLADAPSAKSLAMFALDFGHEIFIMSRRGYPGSQAKMGNPVEGVTDEAAGQPLRGPLSDMLHGLTNYGHLMEEIRFSMNRNFWNFSADEQARYDWPMAVNFVRETTKRDKIAIVGHSLGGAITLMALSMFPELNDKIAAAVLLSQSFSNGHGDLPSFLTILKPLLQYYTGPFPPSFMVGPVLRALDVMCTPRLLQWTLCAAIDDMLLGFSGGKSPMRPELVNSIFYASPSLELAQLLQTALLNGQMHTYSRNGLKNAKPYDLSKVTNTKLSFYLAPTDSYVSYADSKSTLPELKVPHRTHSINQAFNHNSYFWHKNNTRQVTLPALQDIQELSELPPTPANSVAKVSAQPSINANSSATTTAGAAAAARQ